MASMPSKKFWYKKFHVMQSLNSIKRLLSLNIEQLFKHIIKEVPNMPRALHVLVCSC